MTERIDIDAILAGLPEMEMSEDDYSPPGESVGFELGMRICEAVAVASARRDGRRR